MHRLLHSLYYANYIFLTTLRACQFSKMFLLCIRAWALVLVVRPLGTLYISILTPSSCVYYQVPLKYPLMHDQCSIDHSINSTD